MATRTRFAPSPTGDLHLGGAWTALASWVVARRDAEGANVLRVEDLDTPRVLAGSEARIRDDLRWLGLPWDEEAPRQSTRGEAYADAVAKLSAAGLVYPCDCSRAEIARAASAPHAGEEGIYPGSCRDADPHREMKRAPSLRVRVPDAVVAFEDQALGPIEQNLAQAVGDFVLRRGDGVYAYQLAVVVDDAANGITDVVRGADLALSTPRQIWLGQALGLSVPRFTHVALVVATDGARLEKRTPGATVHSLRDAGVTAEEVLGELAFGLGLVDDRRPATASSIAQAASGRKLTWRTAPWAIPVSLVHR